MDELGVDRLADIGARGRLAHADRAGLALYLDLRGGHAHLPEDRSLGVRPRPVLGPHLAGADDLALEVFSGPGWVFRWGVTDPGAIAEFV